MSQKNEKRNIVDALFVPTEENGPGATEKLSVTVCRICKKNDASKPNKFTNKGSGYTNPHSHLLNQHPDWNTMFNKYRKDQTGSDTMTASAKSIWKFKWLKCLVKNNLPFSFVENAATRVLL